VIYDRPYEPVRNIIQNLNNANENIPLLRDVTERWLYSYELGCFIIESHIYNYVKSINDTTKNNIKYLF
jgi:hypothetical protein